MDSTPQCGPPPRTALSPQQPHSRGQSDPHDARGSRSPHALPKNFSPTLPATSPPHGVSTSSSPSPAPSSSVVKAVKTVDMVDTSPRTSAIPSSSTSVTTAIPFTDQVGGHSPCGRLPDEPDIICKPANRREVSFYETFAPSTLRAFIPKYHGVRMVNLAMPPRLQRKLLKQMKKRKKRDNRSGVTHHIPGKVMDILEVETPVLHFETEEESDDQSDASTSAFDSSPPQSPQHPNQNEQETLNQILSSPEPHLGKKIPHQSDKPQAQNSPHPSVPSTPGSLSAEVPDEFEWFRSCLNHHLAKGNDQTTECILLQDLTEGFNKPCIMDLKVGTRTYKDDATPAKKERALKKAQETTTASLGLRVCGVRVYDRATDSFDFEDKYMGRKLTPDTIQGCFQQYFRACPTKASRKRAINLLIRRVEALTKTMEHLTHFRFYSTSLLIIYDAEPFSGGPRGFKAELKMIDFANSHWYSGAGCDPVPEGFDVATPDEGFVFGLQNLKTLLQGCMDNSGALLVDEDAHPHAHAARILSSRSNSSTHTLHPAMPLATSVGSPSRTCKRNRVASLSSDLALCDPSDSFTPLASRSPDASYPTTPIAATLSRTSTLVLPPLLAKDGRNSDDDEDDEDDGEETGKEKSITSVHPSSFSQCSHHYHARDETCCESNPSDADDDFDDHDEESCGNNSSEEERCGSDGLNNTLVAEEEFEDSTIEAMIGDLH